MDDKKPFRSGHASLIGRANVGKSTLLNHLVGEKLSIVSPVAQTTRHRVLGVRNLPHGQVAFIDSPGYSKADDQLGELMLEKAQSAGEEADVVLFMVDAAAGIGPGDRFVLDQLKARQSKSPILLVLNKVDQMNKGRLLPMIKQGVEEWDCREVIPVSAMTGENCDDLLETVVSWLPEGPAHYPESYRTDQRERMLIAEIIREKLLERLRQEVPHSVAVAIEHMDDREDGLIELGAVIYVQRASHKGIVIGQRGRQIKEVGMAARKELEERYDRKVFLQLWVKVKEDWRDKTSILRDLGLFPG